MFINFFLNFLYKKKVDFSAQFDESCITYTPSPIICKNHGPIKFIREDFGGCIECNDKWRSFMYKR